MSTPAGRRPDEVGTMTAEFAELRRLAEAATPGPWVAADDPSGAWVHAGWAAGATDTLRTVIEWTPHPEDAALIAAAVNALPALLDAAAERDALAAKVERVQAILEAAFGTWDSKAEEIITDAIAAMDEEAQP